MSPSGVIISSHRYAVFTPLWLIGLAGAAVLLALVERQKFGLFSLELGAEFHFLVVDGQVDGATA